MKRFIFILLMCTGCQSTYYHAQPIDLPCKALENAAKDNESVCECSDTVPENWWVLFNDEQLTNFIETALENNPTLQATEAKIFSSKYEAEKTESILYPFVNFKANVERDKLSKTGVVPFVDSSPAFPFCCNIPEYFSLYEVLFNFKYDLDLWGKKRNQVCAALGDVQTKIADNAFARLAMSVSVAQVYYQLQIEYQRNQIAKKIISNREEYQNLVNQKVAGNLDSIISTKTAESYLTMATKSLLLTEANISANENQLRAFMASCFDENIVPIEIVEKHLPCIPFPDELPLNLIAHRPDIMAQLWVIESASRYIEVSKIGFYPDINLTSFLGFQTIHLKDWFEGQSAFGNIRAATDLPLFDGFWMFANLKKFQVNYDLAIYQYNQLVINAVKEVLDGLTLLRNADQQLSEFKKETEYKKELLGIISARIESNMGSRLDYLNTEQQLLMAQDQELLAIANKINAMLKLIKAIGGGYEGCICEREGS